jgi:transposase-like protein
MSETTTSVSWENVLQWRLDVHRLLGGRLSEAVEAVLEEEVQIALGAASYERTASRRGYRNGGESRPITTVAGTRELRVPRARVSSPDGTTTEFHSEILPRYARRTREVDEAILGVYLAGTNSRRIRKALQPLLGEQHLSKSAVSRIVGRLKELFAAWEQRDLAAESYPIVFLDGFHLKVRLVRKVVTVPVLAALGVAEDGTKVLVGLRLAVSEATNLWDELVTDLKRRGLREPLLLVVDGHAGLAKALAAWPNARVQRCTLHKLRNLLEHCPRHAHAELKRDYHRIIHARNGLAARGAYAEFLRKWSQLCPPVARSLEEAGELLLTFYDFPKSMWKALRSTNALENLNREFRRRTKTQGSFATEQAALTLLWGLVAFGQIKLRKLVGYHNIQTVAKAWTEVA